MHDLVASCRSVFTHSKRKAEPTRVRTLRGLRQNEDVFEIAKRVMKLGKVGATRGDETGQLFELRNSDGGLHVSRLEVVADMAVNIFVVVARWQVAEFPLKAATAGVRLSGITPAVAAPIA